MKLILSLLIFFMTLSFGSETENIRVGIYDNAPKIFLDQNHQPSGFFVHLLNNVAEKERWKIDYVECEWNSCLEKLQSGQLDIMPDVAYSQNREAKFRFNNEVILSIWSTVYTRNKSDISSLLDLDNKKIAMMEGSIQYQQIQETFNLFN